MAINHGKDGKFLPLPEEMTLEQLAELTYSAWHNRIKRKHGSASLRLCEGGCGKKAALWATVHDRWPAQELFKDIVPLCRSCHIQYDMTEEWKQHVSAALKGRPDYHTPEGNAAISKAIKAWHEAKSPEQKTRDAQAAHAGRTSEVRSRLARKASEARWAKPEWQDPEVRENFARKVAKARYEDRTGKEEGWAEGTTAAAAPGGPPPRRGCARRSVTSPASSRSRVT
jgi:hypothetical protein